MQRRMFTERPHGFPLLSTNAKILGRRLACPGHHQLVPDLGTRGEAGIACLLDRRNMDENFRATAVRDETIAFSRVETTSQSASPLPVSAQAKKNNQTEADSSAVLVAS